MKESPFVSDTTWELARTMVTAQRGCIYAVTPSVSRSTPTSANMQLLGLAAEGEDGLAEVRSKADSLPAVDKGSWLDNGNAESVPRGIHEFSGTSVDVEGQPSLHALPQAATMQSAEGTGPNIFPLSMQAQASAGDDGQPYFLDIFLWDSRCYSSVETIWCRSHGN